MVLERVLPLARCPECLGPLTLRDLVGPPAGEGGQQIVSGILGCPACQTSYRIVDGIPILYPR
jgi:uncharacterized protein YbaR (Trm112 family)